MSEPVCRCQVCDDFVRGPDEDIFQLHILICLFRRGQPRWTITYSHLRTLSSVGWILEAYYTHEHNGRRRYYVTRRPDHVFECHGLRKRMFVTFGELMTYIHARLADPLAWSPYA